MSGALDRVAAALVRAEEELPRLAAPDGTVAVRIEDLREVLNTHSSGWQDILTELLSALEDVAKGFIAYRAAVENAAAKRVPLGRSDMHELAYDHFIGDDGPLEAWHKALAIIAKAKPLPSNPSGEA